MRVALAIPPSLERTAQTIVTITKNKNFTHPRHTQRTQEQVTETGRGLDMSRLRRKYFENQDSALGSCVMFSIDVEALDATKPTPTP